MSNKEMVLQHYPFAICEKSTVSSNYLVVVYNTRGKDIIGIGLTDEQAWTNAFERL